MIFDANSCTKIFEYSLNSTKKNDSFRLFSDGKQSDATGTQSTSAARIRKLKPKTVLLMEEAQLNLEPIAKKTDSNTSDRKLRSRSKPK